MSITHTLLLPLPEFRGSIKKKKPFESLSTQCSSASTTNVPTTISTTITTTRDIGMTSPPAVLTIKTHGGGIEEERNLSEPNRQSVGTCEDLQNHWQVWLDLTQRPSFHYTIATEQ
ncbi:unnamed protein product [Arctogadus glacialis]